jgi:hypothetical protein
VGAVSPASIQPSHIGLGRRYGGIVSASAGSALPYGLSATSAGRGASSVPQYASAARLTPSRIGTVRRLTIGEPTRRLGNSTRSYDKLPVLEIEPRLTLPVV